MRCCHLRAPPHWKEPAHPESARRPAGFDLRGAGESAHTRRIAEILGFSGVDFSVGPYFRSPASGKGGLQIDLLFSRADNVISLCEMKCSVAPIGIGIVKEVERKAQLLQSEFPSKTIQRVLVVHGEPSRELARSGYFYRTIQSADLAS